MINITVPESMITYNGLNLDFTLIKIKRETRNKRMLTQSVIVFINNFSAVTAMIPITAAVTPSRKLCNDVFWITR